jgi:hypothetical protein
MNGALDGALNSLDVVTHRHIRRSPVYIDAIFQSDPAMAMVKKGCVVPFPGGRVIAFNITFDTLLASAYDVEEDFDLSTRKTDEQMQVMARQYQVNVTTNLEMLEAYNTGPDAVARDIDSKLRNGYNTIGSSLAGSMYLKNNTAGYTKLITGFAEAISDGANASWDGVTYASYGGLTRTSYNGALVSYRSNLNGAQIEYDDITDAIQETSWGDGELEANAVITTPKLKNSLKKRFQIQQVLNEKSPVIGFAGISVENSTIFASRYCPGQDVATAGKKSNRVMTNFLRGTTRGAVTTYPAVSGETAFICNIRKPNIHLHVSSAPRYQFGTTGWKLFANSTKLVNQILWLGQLTLDNPSFFGTLINAA